MKPNPQRYIDLNHSGSNGAKAPPQSPNGYPGTEAPFWSLPGSGAEALFGANPAPLPRADLAHLGAETALGLFRLFWSRGSSLEPSSSIWGGDSFWSPPGSTGALWSEALGKETPLEPLPWLFWSGSSFSEPL